MQEVPDGRSRRAGRCAGVPPEALPGPESGTPVRFALDGSNESSFAATAMEMRWLNDPWALGPGRVWMRLRHPLLPGEPLSRSTRLAATADFGNGVSAALPFERFLFINADLTIHLQRLPRGEWIGLDARTLLHDGGTGLAEAVLHDEQGRSGGRFRRSSFRSAEPGAGWARGTRVREGSAHDDVAERLVDRRERVRVERDAGGGGVRVHLLGTARTDDRRGDVLLAQHPRERQLRHRQAGLIGDRPQPLDGLEHGRLEQAVDEAAHRSLAARESAGGGSPGRYLPVSTP